MNKNKKAIKIVVYIAILTVIGCILNFIEIPYIVPWLKLDISEVVTLIAAAISLPVAIGVAVAKSLFMALTGTSSGFIGEITLFIGSLTIIGIYTLLKDRVNLFVNLASVVLGFTVIMTALNYFIITPFYMGESFTSLVGTTQKLGETNYSYLIYVLVLYVPFNLIKMIIDVIIFYFLNKSLMKVVPNVNFGNKK